MIPIAVIFHPSEICGGDVGEELGGIVGEELGGIVAENDGEDDGEELGGIVAGNSVARSGDKGSSVTMASMIASPRAPVATESVSVLCALLTISSLDTALPE